MSYLVQTQVVGTHVVMRTLTPVGIWGVAVVVAAVVAVEVVGAAKTEETNSNIARYARMFRMDWRN